MGLLKVAKVEQAAAKVGVFGPQGSGKTTTSILLAIGLSKTYHNSAPIVMMDTETGSDFMVPICEAEGVPFMNVKSRAFKDMRAALREAEDAGACVFLVDSYTHPWIELVETFKAKSQRKKLEFHHMDSLKSMWRGWTDQMLNSPLHVVLAGRLGYVWDREADDADGKGDLIKLGTKMKSESEAGYEPSLLIEMEGLQEEAARVKKSRRKQGSIQHHAYVLKDRWRTLNGRTFTFKDMNEYKPGAYKVVFDAFRPHFDRLALGQKQQAVDSSRSSAAMFDGQGENVYQQIQRRKQIALEEIQGSMVKLWPGQDAKSKALKGLVVELLFDTKSWTAVEGHSVELLESRMDALRLLEQRVEDGTALQALTEANDCRVLLSECMQAVKAEADAAAVVA